MEKFFKFVETLIIILLILIGIWATIYNFYMTWFRPSDYQKQLVNRVNDWQPFANFYRSYYASWHWLWAMRLGSLFFVLVIGFLLGGTLLHFLGLIP
jgi:hypothetical protein